MSLTGRAAATLAVATLVLLPVPFGVAAPTRTGFVATTVQRPWAIQSLARARAGAARRLQTTGCLAVLDEFTDAAGHTLRKSLEAEGIPAHEFLDRLHFFEAPAALCNGVRMAATSVRSRVIYLCSERFRAVADRNRALGEAAVIHEALHALGLGENPPASEFITERVLARCG
jgi:hypothetical protein